MTDTAVLDMPPGTAPATVPEGGWPEVAPPPEPLESGDWVWTVYWCEFALPGNPKNGSWQSTFSRVVTPGKLICHEVSNPSDAAQEGSGSGSLLRWCSPERVFRTRDGAVEACRTLPAPT